MGTLTRKVDGTPRNKRESALRSALTACRENGCTVKHPHGLGIEASHLFRQRAESSPEARSRHHVATSPKPCRGALVDASAEGIWDVARELVQPHVILRGEHASLPLGKWDDPALAQKGTFRWAKVPETQIDGLRIATRVGGVRDRA